MSATRFPHRLAALLAAWTCGAGPAPLSAEPIASPAAMFRDPQFAREFVGSYGILSDVEPPLGSGDRELLAQVQELLAKGALREAEQAISTHLATAGKQADRPKATRGRGQVAVQTTAPSASLHFILGNLYFASDRPAEAQRAFLEAIRLHPRFRRACTNLGYLHLSQNRPAEALAALQRAVELGDSAARTYGLIGYCHLQGGNPLAAENAYRQAYLLDPKSRDWKTGLAQALMQQDKYEEATAMFGALIAENPNDRQLWMQQANALLAREQKLEAAVNLEVLRRKGLATEADLNLLGNLYLDQGEAGLALIAYEGAVAKATKPDIARSLKSARILNERGHPEKAAELLAALEKAGQPQPAEQFEIDLLRARIEAATGDRTASGKRLESLLERDPGNAELLLELARHYDNLSKDEADETRRTALAGEAKTRFKLALEKPAVAYAAHLGLGQLLVRERRYTESLPLLERALALKPGDKASLEQYLSRVRRAADREAVRKEREEKARAEAAEPKR